jgi:arylsulfatase A-like enzyme
LRVRVPVSLVDILPTLVDALELEVDGSGFVGQSLWPTVREGDVSALSGVVFGDATPDRDDTIVCVRTDEWKLIFDSTKGGYELYNLLDDASEEHNLAHRFPGKVRELSQVLWDALGAGHAPLEPVSELELDAEVLSRLQALGYIEWVEEHGDQKAT